MNLNKKVSVNFIMLTLLAFVLFWALLTDAWGTSKFIFPNNFVIGEYFYGYIIRIIWVGPAFLLILKDKGKFLSISWKELISKPSTNKFFLITLCVIVVYCLTGMFAIHGSYQLNLEHFLLLVIKVLIVGIVEETVFRGWGYNALCKLTTNIKAMILSSLMFAFIHCPAYIIKFIISGHFEFFIMLQQFIIAFFFGIIFCILLRKGKSLWNPIITHSFYDLLAFIML